MTFWEGDKDKKPERWDFDKSLVAPEWEWFWDNALAAAPYWERAGNPYDYVQKKFYNDQTQSNVWGTGAFGRTLISVDPGLTEGQWLVDVPGFSASLIYTLIFTFDAEDTSGNGSDFVARLVGLINSGDSDTIETGITTEGWLHVATRGGNTTATSTKIVDDELPHNAAVVDDQINSRMIIWIDGEEQFDISYTNTSFGGAGSTFGIYNQHAQGSVVNIYQASVLETTYRPPDSFLRNITLDPFGPFRMDDEDELRLLAAAAAGGANPHGPLGHPLHGPFGGPV